MEIKRAFVIFLVVLFCKNSFRLEVSGSPLWTQVVATRTPSNHFAFGRESSVGLPVVSRENSYVQQEWSSTSAPAQLVQNPPRQFRIAEAPSSSSSSSGSSSTDDDDVSVGGNNDPSFASTASLSTTARPYH